MKTGKKAHECEHDWYIPALSFSRDGKSFYAVTAPVGKSLGGTGKPQPVVAWSATTGKRLRTFEPPEHSAVVCLAVNGDGSQVVGGGVDGTVIVWDSSTGKQLHSFAAHKHQIVEVVFSADGKYFVTASLDKTVVLWSAKTRRMIRTFEETAEPTSVSISPDGKRLAVSSKLGVTLCGLFPGKNRSLLKAMGEGVDRFVFHPKGKLGVTTSPSGSVRVWDISTGEECACIVGLVAEEDWLVLTPSGLFDASKTARNKVKYWADGASRVRTLDKCFHRGLLTEIWEGRRPMPVKEAENPSD